MVPKGGQPIEIVMLTLQLAIVIQLPSLMPVLPIPLPYMLKPLRIDVYGLKRHFTATSTTSNDSIIIYSGYANVW